MPRPLKKKSRKIRPYNAGLEGVYEKALDVPERRALVTPPRRRENRQPRLLDQ